jgi:hypothetical protein
MAAEVLPILDDALQNASENEVDWILEAFYSIIDKVGDDGKELIKRNAEMFADAKKNATRKRVQKILKKIK